MMYSAYKLNKQDDNIQPWRNPFPIWNQSIVPCPVLTVASWPAYRFLEAGQVVWYSHLFQNVQAGFRKGRGTRDQIANICWIIEKCSGASLKLSCNYSLLPDYPYSKTSCYFWIVQLWCSWLGLPDLKEKVKWTNNSSKKQMVPDVTYRIRIKSSSEWLKERALFLYHHSSIY